MRRVLHAALGLIATGGVVAAQPIATPTPFDEALAAVLGQPGGLTADSVAVRAAKASTVVQRKTAELDAARTDLTSLGLALVPRTTVTAGYTRLSDLEAPVIAGVFSFPIFVNTYHLGADVAVPLTSLFVRLPILKRASEHGIVASEIARRSAQIGAAASARIAYYEWVRARLQTVVAERLLAQVTANLEYVRSLAAVQRVSKADVLRLEAQQAQAELAVAQVAQGVAIRVEQLRAAIGATPDEVLAIGDDVRAPGVVPRTHADDQLLRTALDRRLELDGLDAAAAALREQRKAARVDRLPELAVFGQAVYDNPNQRLVPADDVFKFTWAAGVRASWSLNDFLHATPHDDRFAAEERALAADRAGAVLAIRGEVTVARQSLDLAGVAVESTRRGLVAAEESYRVRQELLAADRATALELVDAETELTRARIATIDAMIDLRIAGARLDHATGEDIR